MPRENRMKVCLVAISLGRGGAERSTALLSQMLERNGHEVHTVILNDSVDYPYSGKLFNLGKFKTEEDTIVKRIFRFRKLRAYLKEENFDCIIDNRNRYSTFKEWYYLHYIYRGFRLIYVIRSANLDQYLPKNKWLVNQMIARSWKIVGVSKHIAQEVNKLYATDKAVAIYNPVADFSYEEKFFNEKYIIFVGRLVDSVKNISLLLEGYKKSILPTEKIGLKILGSGQDLEFLVNKTSQMGLSHVVDFIPFQAEVYPFLKNAMFSVLTSRYEGFPRALLESLSVGTPVVSVDCVSGPNEIVIEGQNGLLVENFNVEALTAAMDRMVVDTELYQRCKQNSKKSISHLSLENIAGEWNKILQDEQE